jgi:hypothetical protein
MRVPKTDNPASTISRGIVNLREEKKALFSVFFFVTNQSLLRYMESAHNPAWDSGVNPVNIRLRS